MSGVSKLTGIAIFVKGSNANSYQLLIRTIAGFVNNLLYYIIQCLREIEKGLEEFRPSLGLDYVFYFLLLCVLCVICEIVYFEYGAKKLCRI